MGQVKNSIATIVVTHNRKELLVNCLEALLSQTRPCDIIVVDNASTDGTESFIHDKGYLDDDRIHYLRLRENAGGAGGFCHGLKYAMSRGWEWLWLMDDDAQPESSALDNLARQATDSNTIYGSAPVGIEDGEMRLCWTITAVDTPKPTQIKYYEALKDIQPVERMPFLGFFIHRDVVHLVGLPDPDFFIYHDDNDYCERARKRGVKFVLVKSSIIMHPLQKINIYPFLGKHIQYRSMPPWKVYYDVRNTIRVAKRHCPLSLWSKAMPNILIRLFCSVSAEKNTFLVLHAYAMGILHGLVNKGGRRLFP
ncbi:MAG: glycosyltransferase family 2 protein [Thermodesulfobacteriota bacterium]|nr:glycosyltransferase family 2 protein [Thermodesulfobacteriota bacterium]